MGILFSDKASAKEYAGWVKEEGFDTIIRRRRLGVGKTLNWEVERVGRTKYSESEEKLMDSGIPAEHILTYEAIEGQGSGFSAHIKPRVRTFYGKVTAPHVLVAHELAHQKLGHDIEERRRVETPSDVQRIIGEEKEAWGEAIKSLKRAGEWNKETKEVAAQNLAGYYRWILTEDDGEAEALRRARADISGGE